MGCHHFPLLKLLYSNLFNSPTSHSRTSWSKPSSPPPLEIGDGDSSRRPRSPVSHNYDPLLRRCGVDNGRILSLTITTERHLMKERWFKKGLTERTKRSPNPSCLKLLKNSFEKHHLTMKVFNSTLHSKTFNYYNILFVCRRTSLT